MDQLAARAAALIVRSPGDVRLRRVGVSRAGTPLWLLCLGRGARQALVVAGPHANEPVGGATVLRPADRVLADPRLTVGADATWNLLLCLDPDGLRRNEGWLTGPYSLGRHFRNFFRPGFLEQPITEAAVESTWYHPHRHGTLTAVVEAPMWGVAAVEDGSPPAGRDAVLRAVSGALRHDVQALERILARVRPHLAGTPDTARLLAPVDDHLLVCRGLANAWDADTADPGRPLPPLSTGHLTALRIAGRRIAVRTAGLLHQLVRGAGRDPSGVLPELDRLIDAWCAGYQEDCGARWIPVARQAEYQARVVSAAFEPAGRRAAEPAPGRSGESDWGSGPAVPMHRE
ncbi:M14 family zinc carboxypeptidase [Streptomyces sp. ME18-1-4]|uniref:M14 family zinc carboxypeptidase n=1 Tax=Streptomyces sp. ME18-1-4 TaxID=3028685 RepID=UPI0029AFC7D2|nr:M14 family zinc carboxypeptidase [Streptomyces sp. ME18-1-4]MDX3244244.1 M14 family zinc carboxypeptidase [Streptomyces sp. ME18-1-4]